MWTYALPITPLKDSNLTLEQEQEVCQVKGQFFIHHNLTFNYKSVCHSVLIQSICKMQVLPLCPVRVKIANN